MKVPVLGFNKRIGLAIFLVFIVIFVLLASQVVMAADPPGYSYTVTNGQATITGYTGGGGAIFIPSNLGGYPVTAIGDSAFLQMGMITSVYIPQGITSIGNYAFYYCSLSSVNIPDSVTSIGYHAFDECNSLTSITIPSSVTSMGTYAFFHDDLLVSVTLESGVTSISNNEFSRCGSLASIVIPGSVTSIGVNAFAYCPSLTNITFLGFTPPSTGVGWVWSTNSMLLGHAYAGSSFPPPGGSLNYLTMGAYLAAYSYTTSSGQATITRYHGPGGYLTLPSTLDGYPVTAVGDNAFSSTNVISVIIPSSVTRIGNEAFSDCASLRSITIPNSVLSIGESAFSGCRALTSVTIPNSITTISDAAFAACTSLTSITLPNSVTRIGNEAFSHCFSLPSIIIPTSVTSIGDKTFQYCSSLTDITFLGLTTPTTETYWIYGANSALLGHAYSGSSFPPPGSTFNYLTMGSYIDASPQVTFSANGLGSDAGSTIVLIIDGTGYTYANIVTNAPLKFNWAAGSTHTIAASTQLSAGSAKRYVFSSWINGDGLSTSSGTYTVPSSNQIVTASYTTQYKLTMSTSAGTTSPAIGDHWYNAGTVLTISATPPSIGSGERYTWDGWTGTGTISYTGSAASPSITINSPVTEATSWTHQYYLTVNNGGHATASGSGWYDYGTSASFSVSPTTETEGSTQYNFAAWSGDSTSTLASDGVTMNGPKTVTATWNTITLDTAPPVSNANALQANTNSLTFDVSYTASDSGSGVQYVELYYRRDGGSWTKYSLTYTSSPISFTGSGDGLYEFYTVATDTAGNIEDAPALADASTTIDTTPPRIDEVEIRSPWGGTLGTSSLNVDVNVWQWGNLEISEIRLSNDGLIWSSWMSWDAMVDWTLSSGPEGLRTVYAQARDAAGNVASSSGTIRYDTTPPTGSITINDGATWTNSRTATLSLTYADVGGSGVDIVVYDGSWEYPSATKSWTLSAGDGLKTVYYEVWDNAGNYATFQDTITLDTVAPTGSIIINDGAAYATSASVELTLSAIDAASGVTHMRFSNDGSTWSEWEAYGSSKTWSVINGEGPKTVYVEFKDAAGLTSTSYSTSIIVDSTKPVVTIMAPSAGWYQTSALPSLDYSVTDNLDSSPSTQTNGWSTAEGAHTVTVTATDAAGNIGSASVTYTVDNTAPVITITGLTDGAWYKSLPDYITVEPYDNLDFSPYVAIDGYSSVEGTHIFTVTATDQAGNTASKSLTYTIDNTPPTVAITAPIDGTWYKSSSLPAAAYTVSDNLDASPTVIQTGYLTGQGIHTYTVTAKDLAGNTASTSATYTVDETIPAITIIGLTDGGSYKIIPNFIISIDDFDLYPSYVESGYSNDEGTHTYSITVTDHAGNTASKSVTYTIDRTPPTVTIDAPTAGFYKTSNLPQLSSSATDNLDPNPSIVSITGWSTEEGAHTATVTYTDAAGNTGSAFVTYMVDNTGPIVTITAPVDGSYYKIANVPAGAYSIVETNTYAVAEAGWANTPEGLHTYTVTATDGAGNVGSASITYYVDNTSPVTGKSLSGTSGSNGWYVSNVDITLMATDGGSDVKEIHYNIDGTETTVTGNYASLTVSTDGTHNFEYWAVDRAGNNEMHSTQTIMVDKTPPVGGVLTADRSPDSNGWYNHDVTWTASGASDATSGLVAYGSPIIYTGLDSSSASVSILATDSAGNQATITQTFKYDATAPTLGKILTGVLQSNGWYITDVTVTLTSGDAVSAVASTEYNLNSAGWTAYTGPFTITVEGSNVLQHRVTDNAGNSYTLAQQTINIDDSDPTITITSPINDAYFEVGTVSVSGISSDGTGISKVEVKVDNGAYLPATGTTSWSFTTASLSPGTHSITAKATDMGGTTSETSLQLYVGATSLIYTGATSGQYSDSVTLSATLADSATGYGIPGKIVTFKIGTQTTTATTNSQGIATTTLTLMQPSGSYTVQTSYAADSGYQASSDSDAFTVNKEVAVIIYTGDNFKSTNGATSTIVTLSASLVQQDDGSLGDLTLAKVTFALFKSSNLGSTPDAVIAGVSVNSAGIASITQTLATDVWTIKVYIDTGNGYWSQSSVDFKVLTVTASTTSSVTGGGWIVDSESANSRGNFGFNVQYSKNQGAKGNFVYIYRGIDGYDYIVKSNSWQDGGLSFTGINAATFSGKCVIQKVDPTTGAIVESAGNSRYSVNIADVNLAKNLVADTLGLSFSGTLTSGSLTRTINPTTIGGGNIVVRNPTAK